MASGSRAAAVPALGAILALALSALLLLASPASGQGGRAEKALADTAWPMFQHDPQHTGRSPHVAPSSLALKWRFQVEGVPGSPVIAADGTIYLPTGNTIAGTGNDRQGFLYAINPDGTLRWRFAFPPTATCVTVPTFTTPAIATDGTVYVHTQSGKTLDGSGFCTAGPSFLFAINPDGSQKWAYQLNDGAAVLSGTDLSSPAIGTDGTIYLTSADTGLYAINPDGTRKWVVSPEATSIGSSPAIAPDGTIYVNIFDLHAYSPAGAHLWAADTGSAAPNGNSPSVGADGTIYACSLGASPTPDRCHAVSPAGAINWSVPLEARTITPTLASEGTIYIVGRTDGLHALNPDGSERWQALVQDGTGRVGHSPILGGDGRIYARDDAEILEGFMHVLDPNGSETDAESIPPYFPRGPGTGELGSAIAADGTLYVPQPHNGAGGASYDPNDQHLAAYVQDQPTPPPDGEVDLDLSGKTKQELGKAVKVKASCYVDCMVTGTGELVVKAEKRLPLAKKFKLKKAEADLLAGETSTLKLKLPKKGRKAAERVLEHRGRAKARIDVEAASGDGASTTASRTVKLKRK